MSAGRMRLVALACAAAAGACDIYDSSLLVGAAPETGPSPPPQDAHVVPPPPPKKDAGVDATKDAKVKDAAPPPPPDVICTDAACGSPPNSCIDGGTGAGPSCVPGMTVNCCETDVVPGGSFYRGNLVDAGATVHTFLLDRFEVTVGRFRRFVNLGLGTQVNPPAPGSGASPYIPGSGWNAEWNTLLPPATTSLANDLTCDGDPENYNYTWTNTIQNNEVLPINCISWFEAFAFCAWDGGRLPTNAEWNYAAAGGAEQRIYPWSTPPSSTQISPANAVYDCTGHGGAAIMLDGGFLQCALTDIPPVGSRSPAGDGRWGQSDLAGSMYEWILDWSTPNYPVPCDDCAVLDGGALDGALFDASPDSSVGRVQRGGGYYDPVQNLYTTDVYLFDPVTLYDDDGIRCARDP